MAQQQHSFQAKSLGFTVHVIATIDGDNAKGVELTVSISGLTSYLLLRPQDAGKLGDMLLDAVKEQEGKG